MISSPCKFCHKKDYPKDECLKNCKLLQEIQDMQISKPQTSGYSAIDYGEDNRFAIILPLTATSTGY